MTMENNIKQIANTPYFVSDNGKVFRRGKEVKCTLNSQGYYQFCISLYGTKRSYTIHRLVASLFLDNPESKKCVRHIDGNRANNNVSNLAWGDFNIDKKKR